ncbi:TonB-dependent receptor plug domain-containing protein [Desulfovibrio ferrophilus]|uniref:Putative outer membrane receptor n=1 Tax=Desulfovibrio ferrophilus TaxID=241368 RepID=A0A2Z6AXF5_9BACT|nr:TonB-dependent receptor [Desulfovibrio ferrophilus]BBD07942.1 putative outer membrane receptor [Desulfovibrio ferrophilus]
MRLNHIPPTSTVLFVLALFGLIQATPCFAQDKSEPLALDPVVVTARGFESPLSTIPGSIGVVDENEIELATKASIADAASRIPGVARTGDSPWGQALNIRGLSGSSIIFLIDGKRVNTAQDINAQMGFVMPLDIERIEVLKGPVSALYGTGSIGGVVNVITKKGTFTSDNQVHGELSQSFSTNTEGTDSYGRAIFSQENLWLQLSGAFRNHDDYSGGDSALIPNSRYEDKQFRLASGIKWTNNLSSEVQVLVNEANEIGLPGGTSTMPATAMVTYPRTSNVMVSLDNTWEVESEFLQRIKADAYYMKNDRRVRLENIPNPAVNMIRPGADHETWGGKLQGLFWLGDHTLVAGMDAWNWHMVSSRTKFLISGATITDSPTPNTTMTSSGVFAEDDWMLTENLSLNLGARLDSVNIANQESALAEEGSSTDLGWNIHAGLAWRFAEGWSQNMIVASSYRVADIMERFKNINLGNGTVLSGNPDLDPERSIHLEYGLCYTNEKFTASGSVFMDTIKNFITEERVSSTSITMKNVGDARLYGAEGQARWQFIPHWALYGNVAWLYGRDENSDTPLPAVPPLNGVTGLRYENDKGFWTQGECQWAAGKHNVPQGTDPTPGWATANLSAGITVPHKGLAHSLSINLNNLFDRRFVNYLANARGIELLERGFNAELIYSLKF